MTQSIPRELHETLSARFMQVNGAEAVADYGDVQAEGRRLAESAGVLDLSFRGRICLTGADRMRFLHGQVTNDIKGLQVGAGCYAALVTAKGKMQSDMNVYCLPEELLLDFEPGFAETVTKRLEQYLVADEVQVVDVAAQYGLMSLQGPQSTAVVKQLELFDELPPDPYKFFRVAHPVLGEIYLARNARVGSDGFDVFVPASAFGAVFDRLVAAAGSVGGGLCGWTALETARIEAGIPRFGQDMDESCLPQECGIERRAVSYTKGCYIGQEVLNRLHTMGHVNRELRGLCLADDLKQLPQKGDKLFHDAKEAGFVTSAARSQRLSKNIALGFVRREWNQSGTALTLRTAEGESRARVVNVPFDIS